MELTVSLLSTRNPSKKYLILTELLDILQSGALRVHSARLGCLTVHKNAFLGGMILCSYVYVLAYTYVCVCECTFYHLFICVPPPMCVSG